MITVKEALEVMEEIAPRGLAETWDNTGFQVGHHDWPVNLIWVALDPTYEVITRACNNQVDLLVTHHPLIFRPLPSVNVGDTVGRTIELALKNQLSVLCAHTNLDSAHGGVNDMLAEKLGLKSVRVLRPSEEMVYRSVVYVPKGDEEKVIAGLFASGLGKGDKYSCVSFRTPGTGTFRPHADADPVVGQRGELSQVDEFRLEVRIRERDLTKFRKVLAQVHPYEEVIYDLYPIHGQTGKDGLGRIGDLFEPTTFEALVKHTKTIFGLSMVKIVGSFTRTVKRVAVLSGSGRGLLSDFVASDADVLISGDMGFHDGQQVVDAGKCLIDVGHFASEHVVVEGLCRRLSASLASRNYGVTVAPCPGEEDCFTYV
jgi:dinuclear metal center YbgI/SA1388 family protein